MRVVNEDTRSPRYLRYFSDTPSAIIRLGLESETARVRGWVDSLCREPEASLQALGARLRKAIEGADQVLERRRKAGAARSDHRVREIASLVDDVNSARRSLYGTLDEEGSRQSPAARLGRPLLPPQLARGQRSADHAALAGHRLEVVRETIGRRPEDHSSA